MNRQEQIEYVKHLTSRISQLVIDKIKSGQIPEDWRVPQLQKFLAEKFTAISPEMKRTAKWKYKNDVLIRQL